MSEERDYNWYADVMNAFRQFKLGNSLFRHVNRVSARDREDERYHAIDWDARREAEMRIRLAEFILHNQPSATTKTEVEYGAIEYRTELLVLKMEDFKTIVEAAIQLIPDQKIKEIKAGNPILNRYPLKK